MSGGGGGRAGPSNLMVGVVKRGGIAVVVDTIGDANEVDERGTSGAMNAIFSRAELLTTSKGWDVDQLGECLTLMVNQKVSTAEMANAL